MLVERSQADLADALGSAARDDGTGVVVLIDEMQALDTSEMSAICRSCHRAGQRGLPWYVVGAGLPNLAAKLADAESYAERVFDYRVVDRLDHPDAVAARRGPAANQRVEWDDAAVAFVEAEAGGYPYFLQQFGKSTWDVAADLTERSGNLHRYRSPESSASKTSRISADGLVSGRADGRR